MFSFFLFILMYPCFTFQGDEAVRSKLLRLRFTWNDIVPAKNLQSLDNMVRTVNPSWPSAPAVHVNPKFVSVSEGGRGEEAFSSVLPRFPF